MNKNKKDNACSRWLRSLLALALLLIAQGMVAQTTVTGTVVDNGGEPVTGAHVRWKDAKTGVITDIDGHFALPYNKGNLVVSFLGYKSKEVSVDKKSNIEIIAVR